MTLKCGAKKGSRQSTFTFDLGPQVFMQYSNGMDAEAQVEAKAIYSYDK